MTPYLAMAGVACSFLGPSVKPHRHQHPHHIGTTLPNCSIAFPETVWLIDVISKDSGYFLLQLRH